MKDCILKLYRSAKYVFAEWEPDLVHIQAPGLVIWEKTTPSPSHDLRIEWASSRELGAWRD